MGDTSPYLRFNPSYRSSSSSIQTGLQHLSEPELEIAYARAGAFLHEKAKELVDEYHWNALPEDQTVRHSSSLDNIDHHSNKSITPVSILHKQPSNRPLTGSDRRLTPSIIVRSVPSRCGSEQMVPYFRHFRRRTPCLRQHKDVHKRAQSDFRYMLSAPMHSSWHACHYRRRPDRRKR